MASPQKLPLENDFLQFGWALFLAPMSVALSLTVSNFAVVVVFSGFQELGEPRIAFLQSLYMFAYAFAYAGIVTLVAGIPLYLVASRIGWTALIHFLCGGAVLGTLAATLLDFLMWSGSWPRIEVAVIGLVGMVLGAIGGSVFWWVLHRNGTSAKLDRSQENG